MMKRGEEKRCDEGGGEEENVRERAKKEPSSLFLFLLYLAIDLFNKEEDEVVEMVKLEGSMVAGS